MIRYTSTELERTAPLIAALAAAEGLDAHARSALIRLKDKDQKVDGQKGDEQQGDDHNA